MTDRNQGVDFDAVSHSDWRARVERDVAPKTFEAALIRETLGGLRVESLGAAESSPARETAGYPGVAPFVRGARALPNTDGLPWCIAPKVAVADLERANAVALEELEAGATGLFIVRDSGLAAGADANEDGVGIRARGAECEADWAQVLDGVWLDGIDLFIGVGSQANGALVAEDRQVLARVATQRGLDPTQLRVFGGGLAASGDAAVLGGRAQLVSLTALHERGASDVSELAAAAATLASEMRRAQQLGIAPGVLLPNVTLQVSVDSDQFGQIAKLRALRAVWSALARGVGVEPPAPHVHAVTSRRTLARRDAWTNMLRVTGQVFSAAVGGADAITALAHDELLGSEPSPLGRRFARQAQLVLAEEAHLGDVVDAAGGAYAFEQRTEDLASAAWNVFRDIERAGGLETAAGTAVLEQRVESEAQARAAAIARRRLGRVGVSQFLDASKDANRAWTTGMQSKSTSAESEHRDGAEFEALCAQNFAAGAEASIFLANIGRLRDYNARAAFVRDLAGAGGIACSWGAGTNPESPPATQITEQWRDAARPVAVLCGRDEDYASHAVDIARALKLAGCETLVLAGRPGAHAVEFAEAGIELSLYAGMDVLAALRQLAERLNLGSASHATDAGQTAGAKRP